MEVVLVLDGRPKPRLGQPIYGIGVDGVPHAPQAVDEVLMPHRPAYPEPGQGPGFGGSLHHQQVGVLVNQRNCALGTEVYIGLVHDDHHVRIGPQQLLHHVQPHGDAGGGVGIAQHHPAVVPAQFVHRVREIRIHGHPAALEAEVASVHRVKAVGNPGKHHLSVRVEKRLEGEGQHLV